MNEQEINQFGIEVRKCCKSCANKEINTCGTRKCTKGVLKIRGDTVCEQWEMSKTLQMAGCSRGGIKTPQYLNYVRSIRNQEEDAREEGWRVIPKTNKEIRRMYEEEYGSIFVNNN